MKIIPFDVITNGDGSELNVPSEPYPKTYLIAVAEDQNYVFYEQGDTIPADIIAKMNPVSE